MKLYATDIDEQALAQGRSAAYTAKQLENVSDELKAWYFQEVNGSYVFRTACAGA